MGIHGRSQQRVEHGGLRRPRWVARPDGNGRIGWPGRAAVPAAALIALLAGCSAAGPAVSAGTASGPVAAGSSDAGGSADPVMSGDAAGSAGASTSSGVEVGGLDAGPPVAVGTLNAAQLATRLKAAVGAAHTATIKTSGTGSTSQGVMRYGNDLAMSLTMTAAGRRSRVILVGDVYYMDMGEKAQGKSWLKIDPKGKGQLSKTMGPLLASLRQQADVGAVPPSYAGLTAAAAPGQMVDGVRTVSYTLKQNTKQLIAALPAAQRATLAPALAGMSAVTTFAVGPDWLPRRVTVTTTAKGKKATTVITYSHWGQAVTITPPPASDVITGLG
jgi:hypothetical protein